MSKGTAVSPDSTAGRIGSSIPVVTNQVAQLSALGQSTYAQAMGLLSGIQAVMASADETPDTEAGYESGANFDADFGGSISTDGVTLQATWPADLGDLKQDEVKPIGGTEGTNKVDFSNFDIVCDEILPHTLVLAPLGEPPSDPPDPTYPDDVEDDTGTAPLPPQLSDIVIPSAPLIDLAPFDRDLIPWNVDDPGEFVWGDQEQNYQSDIWSDLLTKVIDSIRNGGTGLDVEVEEDIYLQHLNRTQAENEKLYNEAENYWAARGFTLPPGMLSAKINEISSQIARNNLQASRDITINQAELAQKNTHFFIEKGAQLEGMLRQFFVQQVNLTFQAQKELADNAILIYDAKVKKFNYYLEEFKAWMAKHESDIRFELAKFEKYKIEMEGAKIHADVNSNIASIYNYQIQGFKSRVDAYTAKVQANIAKAEVEKLKVQIFAEEVKAFLGKVEINKAKVQEFEAKISGEIAKVEKYKAEVGGFVAETEGKKAQLSGQVSEQQAYMAINEGKVREYVAKAEGYKARIAGVSGKISEQASSYRAYADGVRAKAAVETARIQGKVGQLQAEIQDAKNAADIKVASINAGAQVFAASKGIQMQGAIGIAQVAGQLAAAALNAVNVGASLSYNGQDGYTYSKQDSFIESHNYSYDE